MNTMWIIVLTLNANYDLEIYDEQLSLSLNPPSIFSVAFPMKSEKDCNNLLNQIKVSMPQPHPTMNCVEVEAEGMTK